MLEKNLSKIGFSPSEIKIYLHLLKTGSSYANKISSETKINRTNVYEALERLISKGVVSFITKNKIKWFEAKPAESVLTLIKEKEEELKTTTKEFLDDINKLKIDPDKKSLEANVFVGKKGLFIRLLFNCIPRKELEIEILAQVKSFKQLGLNLYHADVHQHFHCFLVVMKALMNVAIIENIPYIRLPSELSFSSLTNTFLTLMFLNSKKKWQPFIGSSNYFLGLSLTGKINEERLLQSLNQLKSGITELMCHPGYIDDSIKNISRLNKREQELNTLKSSGVKDYIKEKKIVLTTYRNLMLKN